MSVTSKIVAAVFSPEPPIPADSWGGRVSPAQPENIQYGPLTLIKDDGDILIVRCTKWTATDADPVCSLTPPENIFYSVDHKQAFAINSRYLSTSHVALPPNLATMAEIVPQKDLDRRISALRKPLLSKRAEPTRLAKEREQRIAIYKNRTFNVIVGALITPLEMGTGVVRMAIAIARVAHAALALGIVKVKKSLRRANITHIEVAEKRVGEIASFASRQVRIALLQFVPIIGAQLANQYKQTQGLKGFIDSPAIGGLLNTLLSIYNLTIPHLVYGDTKSPFPTLFEGGRISEGGWDNLLYAHKYEGDGPSDPKKNELIEKYWRLPAPTVDDAKTELEAHRYPLTLVRIPVKTHDGKIRYHDATMSFATANKGNLTAKTVIMYHPAGDSRLNNQEPYDEQYLAQGYNVLYASYAGDDFIEGTGKEFKRGRTACSENAMQEDAKADIAFLQALNVKEIGIYGFSLGGAQAMNCAQAAASSELKVHFTTINKSFSNGVDVTGRLVKNVTGSRFLERLVNASAKRFFAEESDRGPRCDGLDNVGKLRQIQDTIPFKETKFTIIGGYDDELMGEANHPTTNFAHDLFSAVKDLGERATLLMESTGHIPAPFQTQ